MFRLIRDKKAGYTTENPKYVANYRLCIVESVYQVCNETLGENLTEADFVKHNWKLIAEKDNVNIKLTVYKDNEYFDSVEYKVPENAKFAFGYDLRNGGTINVGLSIPDIITR